MSPAAAARPISTHASQYNGRSADANNASNLFRTGSTPGVNACHRVVPHGAHEHAAYGCKQPFRLAVEEVRGDAHVRDRTQPTDGHEGQETRQPTQPALSLIAIGERVV